MAKLVLSSGGNVLNQYFIGEETLRIGRGPGNEIVIDDPAISREQARIIAVGNDHIVEDLGSSNGTHLNGTPVTRKILQHRDVMEFGSFSLCYLNSKTAADIDFERTMAIAALARPGDSITDDGTALPAARRATVRWPAGRVQRLTGPDAGHTVALDRVVTLFGDPGERTLVITRRPHGYFVTLVEGRPGAATLNGQAIGAEAMPLRPGDQLKIGDEQLEFQSDASAG